VWSATSIRSRHSLPVLNLSGPLSLSARKCFVRRNPLCPYSIAYCKGYGLSRRRSTLIRSRHSLPEFKNNYLSEMCSGSETGSYLRLIDLCITQL